MVKPVLYSKILLVDDEIEVCNALKEFLEDEQFVVEVAHDGEDALTKADEFAPDCILLDIRMPYMGGADALKMLKLRKPDIEVLMVTAISSIQKAEECMQNGAFGYVTKPVDLSHLLKEIHLALEHRNKIRDEAKKTEKDKDQKVKLESATRLLNKELFHSLRFSMQLVEYFDHAFANHSKNVSWLCENIAKELKIKPTESYNLAGLYHDIGKLSLKDLGYLPQEEWTPNEKEVFNQYPLYGQELVQFHFRLRGLGLAMRHQCEKFDGTGFPEKLSGDAIPLESRVIAVANAFDESLLPEQSGEIEFEIKNGTKALDSVKEKSGASFDPSVVEALERFIKNYTIPREDVVALSGLKEGMRVSRDLFTKGGRVVVPKGITFDASLIKKVLDIHQIDSIIDLIHIYPVL